MSRSIATALLFLVSISAAVAAPARTEAGPNGVRLTKYILGVADLDKTYAFYHALGIELNGTTTLAKPAPLPAPLLKLVDVPEGTKFRNAMMKIPGADFALEVTEFSNLALHPGRPRMHDPGAAVLVLIVRNIDTALAVAKKAGAEVVTIGGAPVAIGPKGTLRAVIVRDPDSYYVEFQQPNPVPASTAPAGVNVIGARFGSVVEDVEKSTNFYRDKFGFEAKVNEWSTDESLPKVGGLQRGKVRVGTVMVPGTALVWTFAEFKNTDAKSYRLRIPDPGAPAIGLEVRDLAAATTALKAAGGSIITTGDGRFSTPNGGAVSFTRDPSGILVELAQSAPKK